MCYSYLTFLGSSIQVLFTENRVAHYLNEYSFLYFPKCQNVFRELLRRPKKQVLS